MDWIGTKRRLSGALAAISAAVVGVILNLSLWFALHVLFDEVQRQSVGIFTLWVPTIATLNVLALGFACVAAWLLLFLKKGVLISLALTIVLGAIAHVYMV